MTRAYDGTTRVETPEAAPIIGEPCPGAYVTPSCRSSSVATRSGSRPLRLTFSGRDGRASIWLARRLGCATSILSSRTPRRGFGDLHLHEQRGGSPGLSARRRPSTRHVSGEPDVVGVRRA